MIFLKLLKKPILLLERESSKILNVNILYKKILSFTLVIICFVAMASNQGHSAGISIDAGLTPAYKRLMFRSQFRYIVRNNHPVMTNMEMKMSMFPNIVAYGLRPDLTLISRWAVIKREMNNVSETGFGDLMIMAKYKLYRLNKPSHIVGVTPTIGIELPFGSDNFTSNSLDLRLGTLFSLRKRIWAADLNFVYLINGVFLTSGNNINHGNEFVIQSAFAYRISSNSNAELLFSPLLETTYMHVSPKANNGVSIANTGESLFLISPGIKVNYRSMVFESLVQIPTWQSQKGFQTERDISYIIGIRLMN
jgi:hypothetical protein